MSNSLRAASGRVRCLALEPSLPRLAAGFLTTRVTKRAATHRLSPLRLTEFTLPQLPEPDYARVRTRLSGICGSDLKTLRLAYSTKSSLVAARSTGKKNTNIPGHEAVGEVVESGADSRLALGQRVVLIPGVFCSALGRALCTYCENGSYLLCENRRAPQSTECLGAGWAEEFVRHSSQLFPLPDSLTDEDAVLIEPLACSMRAVLRRPPAENSHVLVLGSGMIGIGIVAALRALRIPITISVIARYEFQRNQAKALGADHVLSGKPGSIYDSLADAAQTRVIGHRAHNRYLHGGFSVVYDVVGSAESLHHALRWAKPGGAVVLEGVQLFPGAIDRTPIWEREISIVGCHGHGRDDFEGQEIGTYARTIAWLQARRLNPEGFLTQLFPLREYSKAIAAADDKRRYGSFRVAFDFRDDH